VLDAIAYGNSRTPAAREAALTIFDRLLEGTPSPDAYEDYARLVSAIWDDVRSPTTLGWLVDATDVLVRHPCPSPAARASLMSRAISEAHTLRDVDQVAVDVLRVIATDPVLEDAFANEAASLPRPEVPHDAEVSDRDLGPLVVGIYTLSEPAAHRAKAVLERRFPDIDVELNHEHDDSAQLRALAKRADVMAVVISSAKHAATEAIKRSCRPEALLSVGTSGSTGLVRSLLGRLSELAAA
jgi:hypothetical protein